MACRHQGSANTHDSSNSIHRVYKLYQDLPLSEDGLQVRLLQLLPGTGDDPVRCKLVVRRVTAFSKYEALSYTWGGVETAETMTVNGLPHNITTNLWAALWYLRHKSRRRRLWVDAVCIDQTNLSERASQVMEMGQIYRNAERVLLWLGPGDPDTDMALRYVSWCLLAPGEDKVRPFRGGSEQCVCCPYHWIREKQGPPDRLRGFVCPRCDIRCRYGACSHTYDAITRGLTNMLSRDWWQRTWVRPFLV